jgi:hypothetical protein
VVFVVRHVGSGAVVLSIHDITVIDCDLQIH